MTAKMQLNALMDNMLAAGLLDDQFRQMQMVKDSCAPSFIAEIITLFCNQGRRIIDELAKMDKPCVDFKKVVDLLYKLEGSSASVGARRVKNNCIQFRQFCQGKNRDGCLKTLDVVRNNFYDILFKFQTIVQLEQHEDCRKITQLAGDLDPKQHGGATKFGHIF